MVNPHSDVRKKKKKVKDSLSTTKVSGASPLQNDVEAQSEKPGVKRKRSKIEEGQSDSSQRMRTRSMDAVENVEKSAVSTVDSSLAQYRISEATVQVLNSRGIYSLFPIQAKTFDKIYDGQDVLGRARTGMGKTLAFGLPVLERLLVDQSKRKYGRSCRALVMAPTRELAIQVCDEFISACPTGTLSITSIYGGTSYDKQERELRQGVDIVVGTPGRLLDHIDRGNLKLCSVRFFILDEADRMLDMGFKEDVDKILQYVSQQAPEGRQTLLFSATIPPAIKDIAQRYMKADRETVDLVGNETNKASVDVQHLAVGCHWEHKASTIADLIAIYGGGNAGRTIVFTETKKEANELAMSPDIKAECQVLHGDISQSQREVTMAGFREGKFGCLIATDVAARGLDLIVDLVVNYEPPKTNFSGRADVESYIHRSGRTGRAGRKGVCITLFTPKQRDVLCEIERKIGNKIQHIGSPRPEDVVTASADQIMTAITDVDERVIPLFTKQTQQLISTLGAEKALASAIACLSGLTQPIPEKSILTGSPGYITVCFKANRGVFSTRFIWNAVNSDFSEELASAVRGMQLTADGRGGVFDLPEAAKSVINKRIDEGDSPYSCITELPALKPREQSTSGSQAGRGNSWGGSKTRGRNQQSRSGGWRRGA